MASRKKRRKDVSRVIERIARKCGCPKDRCTEYVRFGLEFWRTLHRSPVPDFDRGTKLVVRKWFERGLSGLLLARIGHELVRMRYPGWHRG